MIYKIADLLVEIPAAGGLAPRCEAYLDIQEALPDIAIKEEGYRLHLYPGQPYEVTAYMESGLQFYGALLKFGGMMLHSSAVEVDGRAYLFSGDSGVGKSTHTRQWQKLFGEKAQIFNDDKPALRKVDGIWYAYGTPWCGKDGINQNKKVPLAGICFLKQAEENRITLLSPTEAMFKIIAQTRRKFYKAETLDNMLSLVDQLVRDIPIFELENRPEPEAAKLSYETMLRASQERMI